MIFRDLKTGFTMNTKCPNCLTLSDADPFYTTTQPTNENVLYDRQSEALSCISAEINLQYCRTCGLVYNTSFREDLVDYSDRYKYTLPPTDVFSDFITKLIHTLVTRYGFEKKEIIEFGCGKGEFLTEFCSNGNNIGWGFDTSYEDEANINLTNPRFYNEFYDPVKYKTLTGDLVLARQTLEHIFEPSNFISDMKSAMKFDGKIYLETPNLDWILTNLTFWDFYYEHCTYYSLESYQYLLSNNNLKIVKNDYWYDGQYLSIIAQNAGGATRYPDLDILNNKIKNFQVLWKKKKTRLINYLKNINSDTDLVIWGGAAKGITFCNLFKDYFPEATLVVDINPIRQNKYIPCVGLPIISSDELKLEHSYVVLVMNSQYINEIRSTCVSKKINFEIVDIADI